MSYPYYDPTMTGFHGQPAPYSQYIPATYIAPVVAPAPTVVETKNFVVEPVSSSSAQI
jgi:hypothetical protein